MLYTDMIGRQIFLPEMPQRIISLVPSQTELLYTLGLDERVVGITKFCIHPNTWFRNKTRIGGTKHIDIEKIKSLKPDLIIANKEENVAEQIETLQNFCPVWVSDIVDLDTAYDMIVSVGTMLGAQSRACELVGNIQANFASLGKMFNQKRVAYLIWKDPWMAAGSATFINYMLEQIGLVNVFYNNSRYPVIDIEVLTALNLDYVFLSSEPYPFKEKHITEIQQLITDRTKIKLVDGEMFSWYGSRLLLSATYFNTLYEEINDDIGNS